jgi:lysozyme
VRKTTVKKSTVKRKVAPKRNRKKGTTFFFRYKSQIIIFSLFFLFLSGTVYHYREALLYYFSFKTHKIIKEDKIAEARNFQILEKHQDRTFGLDVSQFQGEINWKIIDTIEEKFPLHFVFIRATAGKDKLDSQFKNNWAAAKENHLIRGAYHYYRPNENSIAQADFFIKNVKLQKGDLPPVLDIEKLPKNQSVDSLKKGLRRWLEKVDSHYKVKPIIYTSEKYYEDFLKKEFSEYTFWIANYNFFVEEIKDDWLFWQFTEKATIDGIQERVDVNIYNGTPKMLDYLTISN